MQCHDPFREATLLMVAAVILFIVHDGVKQCMSVRLVCRGVCLKLAVPTGNSTRVYEKEIYTYHVMFKGLV